MDITAGEYGYDASYSHWMVDAGTVDVLQADATRCLGYTRYLLADAITHARRTEPPKGDIKPDWPRPGIGLRLKAADAEAYLPS